MARPIPANVTLSSSKSTNKHSAAAAFTHPSGHDLTFYADNTIWDNTADKAVTSQDLNRT